MGVPRSCRSIIHFASRLASFIGQTNIIPIIELPIALILQTIIILVLSSLLMLELPIVWLQWVQYTIS